MADSEFRSKVAFIVETDGLLKDYLDSVVIKKIKEEMIADAFQHVSANHLHAALILKNISPCALKEFASTMRMSKSAASALVDRMVKAGVVQREENIHNRREVLLRVSPEFESHVRAVRSEMTKWFETLVDKIGVENFDKWHTVMVALNSVLREEIESGKTSF